MHLPKLEGVLGGVDIGDPVSLARTLSPPLAPRLWCLGRGASVQ